MTTALPPLPEAYDIDDRERRFWHEQILARDAQWQAYATQARADLEADVARLREALNDAATSLETIQLRSYGEDSGLSTLLEVRGYAGNRAKVARAAMEQQP